MTIFMEIAKEILVSEITQIIAHYEQIVGSKMTLQDRELANSKRIIASELLTDIEKCPVASDDEQNIKQLLTILQHAERLSTEAAAKKKLGSGHFKINMDNLTTLLWDIYRELAGSPLETSSVTALKVMDRAFDKKMLKETVQTDETRLLAYIYHFARYYASFRKDMHDAQTGGLIWSTTVSLKNNPKLTSVFEFQVQTKQLIANNIRFFERIKLQDATGDQQKALLALILNDLLTRYTDLLSQYPTLRMYENAKTVVTAACGVATSLVTGVVGFFSASKSAEPPVESASSSTQLDISDDFFVQCIHDALLLIAPEELRVQSVTPEKTPADVGHAMRDSPFEPQ